MLKELKLLVRGIRETGLRPTWDAVQYHVRKLWYRARWGGYRLPSPGAEYVRAGAVEGTALRGPTLTIQCENGSYRVTALAADVIRVRFLLPTGGTQGEDESEPTSYAVARADEDWPPCEVELVESAATVELRTRRLTCRIERESGSMAFLDPDGELINEDAEGAGYRPGTPGRGVPVICEKRIRPDEHFYGLGERTCGLDRRGRAFATWNSDPQSYDLDQDPIYLCIPFLLGLHSEGKQGYGILFDNTFRGRFDLGAHRANVASFAAAGGELRYIFIYGPALRTVVERYTALTGRTRLPPLWSLGYHQSRWSYASAERVRRLAEDFRSVHDVPCDAIHLDIDYMDGFRCFTWDHERFPDPAGLIDELHQEGFKVVTILDAGIKADPDYAVCLDGLEQDAFCTLPNGTVIQGPVWPGDSHFPDFTSPRVRAWWGEWVGTLTEVGVDGIWNDMNEPAVFGVEGTTLPDAVRHDLDGRRGDHGEAHNVYGLEMARATAEGLARLRPERRPFSYSRSGWAGLQRYAAGWTADNAATWDQMGLTMPMVLNLGLSGLAFTGPDTGGFVGHPGAELFTRWLQLSAFLPFFRTHTYTGDPDQEPWSWGEPWLTLNRRWIEHRYRLLPTLYTAFWQCAQTGMPVARPLLLAFQDDPATHTLDDQFLCGDHLLVAPVLEEGATQREVYLPEGTWYDVWTDEGFVGPDHVAVDAPLERVPVFAQGGAVVPVGPVQRYVEERVAEGPTLHVYPPGPDDEDDPRVSVLYEDDGATHGYRDGAYRLSRFALEGSYEGERLRWLRLQWEREGRYEPGYEDLKVAVHGVDRAPDEVSCDGERVELGEIDADGPTLRMQVGLFEAWVLTWD